MKLMGKDDDFVKSLLEAIVKARLEGLERLEKAIKEVVSDCHRA